MLAASRGVVNVEQRQRFDGGNYALGHLFAEEEEERRRSSSSSVRLLLTFFPLLFLLKCEVGQRSDAQTAVVQRPDV